MSFFKNYDNKRNLKKLEKIAAKVEDLVDKYKSMSDEELKSQTQILKDRFKNVVEYLSTQNITLNKLIFAGGVSANQYIKTNMINFCNNYNYEIITPPLKLCTDNGAMIAWAGIEKYKNNLYTSIDTLLVKSRWELDEM